MSTATDADVAHVRSFNRVVTQRIGALNDRYLGSGRPLGQDRLMWEIGVEGCEVRSLRGRLGLDAGHASRLLRALEAAGLATVEPSPADRRVRVARLTRRGRSELKILSRRSDELAASLLDPLQPADRDELIAAMRTVKRLLTVSEIDIRPVDPAGPDAQRSIAAYVAELNRRSERGFDPANGVSAEPHEMTPPAGLFLVAYRNGDAVGCGGVKHHPGAPSEIKRMWVAESARGLGIARRLLADLEREAIASGASMATIETSATLVEAMALYRSVGYVEVAPFNDEPFADHWFEKRL
ncbi:MAG TPA: bifunctional helix-turn-helix transcriptional regulator/GNAT family N-acetyltransferase [Solirubrobacteraceae bacterium]|nr:bifunctional helix-turn-helix transcriptional regulator/GNAT family N-acetyltransferase [Solirubrobacteraceae bacterium]